MLPIFLYPLAFLGLLGIPTLIAIYLLRNRFRRHPVSSLMLWIDTRESREGGRRWRKLQTPLLFLLELLAILLLVFSATDPQIRLATGTRPLVVVLDDSFSMTAGEQDSPREKAVEALKKQLNTQMPYSIRFVLAGERPQLLGDGVRTEREALTLLDGWKCKQPVAKLDQALSLASELGGELSLLLVLTDHASPVEIPETGRLQWWSFGTSQGNIAFVNAARTSRDGLDRCLLEIANIDKAPTTVSLVIEPLEGGKAIRSVQLSLDADETQRMILQFPPGTPAVRARLDDRVLPIDNEVILLPQEQRMVRVDTRIRDRRIRDPILRAVKSSKLSVEVSEKPVLVFSDRASEGDIGNAWLVQFITEKEATAYVGPFILDRTHPLTEGLSLKSAIWGAGKTPQLEGAPVVMAGNIPILSDTETNTAIGAPRHEFRIRFRPEFSTVQESADWPILIWNILSMRSNALPGLDRQNIRLGELVSLNLAEYREQIQLTTPAENKSDLSVKGRMVSLRGTEIGVYKASAGGADFRFAVNALTKDESDLRKCETGRWGSWLDETSIRMEFSGVSWLLLLLLIGIIVLHLLVMARGRASTRATGG